MLSNKALCERFIDGAIHGANTNMTIVADMWTCGDITYLYSYHTVIATRHADGCIEFNPAKYSPSTTRQQQALWWAMIDKGYNADKEWGWDNPKLPFCHYLSEKERITLTLP